MKQPDCMRLLAAVACSLLTISRVYAFSSPKAWSISRISSPLGTGVATTTRRQIFPSLLETDTSSAFVVALHTSSVGEAEQGVLSSLLHEPTLWSILAMSTIVALLVAWEETIHNIRHNTPKPILPVIDSMLAEVGGLGFIGLFLSTVVTSGPLGKVVGEISEEFLGEEELLLEAFEFLHTFFFEVGILFFVMAGLSVGAVLTEVNKLSEISELALDGDGDGEVTLEELAEALQVPSMVVDADGDGDISEDEKIQALRATASFGNVLEIISAEYSKTEVDRAGECLVARERILQKDYLPQTFAIESYFEKIFGHNLEESVELSPVTWLPLIPLIALENSVDLSREVVSASSSNAFESSGYFSSTPWVLYPTIAFQITSLTWAVFNFWKMAAVKNMLLPTLVKDGVNGEAALLPPRYEIDDIRETFNSSPPAFAWAEKLFSGGGSQTSPPRNKHEELFGAVGAKFASVYRDSLRFSTWLSVALVVLSITQIVTRDATALYMGVDVGNPEGLVPELILWSIFAASAVFQLSLAPTTFLNYCYVTSVEKYLKKSVLEEVIKEEAFQAEYTQGLQSTTRTQLVLESGEVQKIKDNDLATTPIPSPPEHILNTEEVSLEEREAATEKRPKVVGRVRRKIKQLLSFGKRR